MGMAWYTEAQWPQLRAISADGPRLEETYAEWVSLAERRFEELKKQGIRVEKVPVDLKDMFAWCRELGRPVDAQGRAGYVTFLLQQRKRQWVQSTLSAKSR